MNPNQIAKASERGWQVYDVCGTLFVLSARNHELIEPGNVLQVEFEKYSHRGKITLRRNPYIWAKIMDHLRGYVIFPIDDETAANAMLSLRDFLKYLHDDARAYGMVRLAQRTLEQFTRLEANKLQHPSNPHDPLPRHTKSAVFYDGNSADMYDPSSTETPLSAPLSAPFDHTPGKSQSAAARIHGSTHACARNPLQPAHVAQQPRSSVAHPLVSTAPVGQSASTAAHGQNLQATPQAPSTLASAAAALGGTQPGVQVPSILVNPPSEQAGHAVPGSSVINALLHGGLAHEQPAHDSSGTPLSPRTALDRGEAAANDRTARPSTNGPPSQPVTNLTTQQLPEDGPDPVVVPNDVQARLTPDLANDRRSSRQARFADNASRQQRMTLQREQDRQNRQQEVEYELHRQHVELKFRYYREKVALAAESVKHAAQLQRDFLMERQRERRG